MNPLPVKAPAVRIAKAEDDLQLLRALCDETVARGRRLRILLSLEGHIFLDPENQVVFESIRFLFLRGSVSLARLAVHLNNRGFPDVNIEKYFPAAPAIETPEENI